MFPRPRIEQIYSQPEYPANVTEVQMVCHHGTHVDAPRHFIADGPSFDQIPIERLFGPGVVLSIAAEANEAITPAMLEASGPEVRRGDIVLLDTGWARRIADQDYEDHPYLTVGAAQWLLDRGAKMLGVDFSTPDLGAVRRPKNYDFPVHHTLLSNGVLIAEHVTNIAIFAGRRIEAMILPLAIQGADGGPSRAIARLAGGPGQ
jgi:kynurenine formamidase